MRLSGARILAGMKRAAAKKDVLNGKQAEAPDETIADEGSHRRSRLPYDR